jgi:hypothetical protein
MEEDNNKNKLKNSKKYNYEAVKASNLDNINFDFDFGDVDDKKHQ